MREIRKKFKVLSRYRPQHCASDVLEEFLNDQYDNGWEAVSVVLNDFGCYQIVFKNIEVGD